MPKFIVLKTVDAFVRYTAKIEAPDAESAAKIAYDEEDRLADKTWHLHSDPIHWEKDSVSEYDACSVVTLDDEGEPIPTTERGKLRLY